MMPQKSFNEFAEPPSVLAGPNGRELAESGR
jgi:hypothetical protein